MTITTLLTFLTVVAATAQTDTTLRVRPGMRLNVDNFGGEIAVQTWDKDAVRIEASHSSRIRVSIEASGPILEVRSASRRGIPGRVDYRITTPDWMPLELSGVYSKISVEGSKGEVSAETVQGDVSLTGGVGFIKLSSVQGMVNVIRAHGRLELSSVNQGVNVSDVEGEISAEAVNGDVILARIRSPRVHASTVNGEVRFLGGLLDGGRYRFTSHGGDLNVDVPDNVSATFAVSSFGGEFESNFPIVLAEGRKGKRFAFTLGKGGALVEMETFQGNIFLNRATKGKAKEKEK